MTPRSTTGKWKRGAAAGAGFALVATLVATQAGPSSLSASSHREAPLIAGDPRADNTDVYAFSTDDDNVALIANWVPFSEPNGGPNFYLWADGNGETEGVNYKINVDNDGDAVADIVYNWYFTTITKDPGQFLVNTGVFDSVTDDTLNVFQTYDLDVTITGDPDDDTDDVTTKVLDDAIAAPSISGAVSTPEYQPLVDEAVASGTIDIPNPAVEGQLKSFAGQADDPFFLDLRVFDLLYGAGVVPEVGEDTLAGYNVNTIALEVPKDAIALNNDAENNPVAGIWSTTERIVQTEGGSTDDDDTDDQFEVVQVSRLGNPLVNEVVIPLALKDAFNSIPPSADATIPEAVAAVRFPILPPLVQAIYGVPVPGDTNNTPQDTSDDQPRSDLVEIFLQGVSTANFGLGMNGEDANTNPALNADLNSLGLNADVDSITPAEMLRLNMAVPVTVDPVSSGVLGGDLQGFPNGRRLADDVVDIELAAAEGAFFMDGADVSALAPFDSVDRNDRNFKDEFPYVALPHLDSVNNGTQEPDNTPRNPSIISINPDRILDTRQGVKAAAGSTSVVNLGDAAVPLDAQAAFLNITAARTEASGFVTAYPCDADGNGDRPVASSLNPDPDRIVSGVVSAVPGDTGNVCIYTETATDLIVDVQAYIPSTAAFTAIAPDRLLDTRGGDKLDADSTQVIDVSDIDGVEGPDGSTAVLINLTSAQTEGSGYITAYPCDVDRPTSSNLNASEGTRRANLASVKVAEDDTICLYSSNETDLTVDIVGAFPAASAYVPLVNERLVDTRTGLAGDSQLGYTGDKPVAGQVIEVDVRGPGTDVPDTAGTVVLNVTGVAPSTPSGELGYFTIFPCGQERPTASNLNLKDLNTAAFAAAQVGDNDRVCIYTFQPAHVLVDIVGFFPGSVLPT